MSNSDPWLEVQKVRLKIVQAAQHVRPVFSRDARGLVEPIVKLIPGAGKICTLTITV